MPLSTRLIFASLPLMLLACGGAPSSESEDEGGKPDENAPVDSSGSGPSGAETAGVQEEEACPAWQWSPGTAVLGPGCVTVGEFHADDLNIAPGTTIKVKRGGFLDVSGRLTANGTLKEPIVIESAEEVPRAGDWGCLWFEGPNGSEIKHITVRHGGNPCQANGLSLPAALILDTSPGVFEEITVEQSAGTGLLMLDNAYDILSFGPIRFNNIAGDSLVVEADAVESLRAPIELDFDDDSIVIDASRPLDFSQPTTWRNVGLPFSVMGTLNVSTPLTIEAGTVIQMDTSIEFLRDSHLIARGTDEEPIVWTSKKTNPGAGDWGCLHFWDTFEESILRHNIIEYGGNGDACRGGESTALRLLNAEVSIFGTEFREISGSGISDTSCFDGQSAWCDLSFESTVESVICGDEISVCAP